MEVKGKRDFQQILLI